MSSDTLRWTGIIVSIVGIIAGIISLFSEVGVGIATIITSIITLELFIWIGDMLDYNQEQVGLLNEVIDELKEIKRKIN